MSWPSAVLERTAIVALGGLLLLGYGLGQAAERDTDLTRASARCRTQGEVLACAEALHLQPGDPGLLTAEADALVRADRPGEAIGVYRNAVSVGADADTLSARMSAAESRRLALVATCESGVGAVALRACDAAWLPGAPDQVRLFRRRGALLAAAEQPSAALDAYLSAERLRPGDRSVALAIARLTEISGRRDATALEARGAALLTLGRPVEAVVSLRDALKLAPNSNNRARLRVAERRVAAAREAQAPPSETVASTSRASEASGDPTSDSPGELRYSNQAPATRTN